MLYTYQTAKPFLKLNPSRHSLIQNYSCMICAMRLSQTPVLSLFIGASAVNGSGGGDNGRGGNGHGPYDGGCSGCARGDVAALNENNSQ